MINNFIVVWDTETGSADCHSENCQLLQISALVIDPRTLTVIPDSYFDSLIKPEKPEFVEAGALAVNGKKMEDLEKAPLLPDVWAEFRRYVRQWNLKNKTDTFSAPIPAGHNIINFDMVIYNRLCRRFGNLKRNKFGKEEPNIFNGLYKYDTLQMLAMWTENLTEPAKLNMDFLRNYFGMGEESKNNAHDALQDVKDTAAILIKLLGLSRNLAPKIKFKDCFK